MLLKLNLESLLAYRGNFINNALASIGWALLTLGSTLLLTTQVTSVYGWSREELILLTTSYGVVIGVFHTFFSKNFERFSQIIHFAQLDSILIKPVDSQFLVSLWLVNYTSILRVIIGIGLTGYFLQRLEITPSVFSVVSFTLLMVVGVILLYSIWFSVITITIWFTRLSNVVELLYNIGTVGRFPREMYAEFAGYVFYFLLPLTFFVITPTKILLQNATVTDVVGLLMLSPIFFFSSRKFWKFALRYYSSASS